MMSLLIDIPMLACGGLTCPMLRLQVLRKLWKAVRKLPESLQSPFSDQVFFVYQHRKSL